MNPNYVHTITIYNRLQASDSPDRKEHWYRHVLNECFFTSRLTAVQGARADTMLHVEQKNSYTVRIPGKKAYKKYVEWSILPEEQKNDFFTITDGDIIIKGECAEEISAELGQTATQLLRKYKPEAFAVTAFSDNTSHFVDKHYRIGG